MRSSACVVMSLLAAPCAVAQPELYGVRESGQLIRFHSIDSAANSPVADLDFDVTSAWTEIWYPPGGGLRDAVRIASPPRPSPIFTPITTISIDTAHPVRFSNLPGVPEGYRIAGVGGAPYNFSHYFLLASDNPLQEDRLAYMDGNGAFTLIMVGSGTGRTDLESLAVDAAGTIFAIGSDGGGALYTINHQGNPGGVATLIGGQGTFGPDTRALASLPDGRLLAAGEGLRIVDPTTGVATLIGPTGYTDIRGLAVATACRANCEPGGPPPLLNIADFTCFLQRFANGDPYANCDRSTSEPMLNVADFTCFLRQFAAGCP